MPLQIPITGVDLNFLVPGDYLETVFAQGPATASAPGRETCLAMVMLTSGTWTAGTLYPITTEQDAITGAGAGSPLHMAARLYLQANKNSKLWALPVAASSGAGSVSRSITITVAGAANAQGTVQAKLGPDVASYTFKSGDTLASIATGLAAAINQMVWLNYTANAVAAVITLTCKYAGASANAGRSEAVAYDTAGVTLALGAPTAGVEGATTEAANLLTALNNIQATRKYYLVIDSSDSTSLTNLKTHIINKSLPRQGLRSVGIFGSRDTLANTLTIATTQNYERLQLVWQRNSQYATWEIAACMAAARQAGEAQDGAKNFDLFRGDSSVPWFVTPSDFTVDFPTVQDMNDAINGGITCIGSDANGTFIVMSCTTRSKNAQGTVNDRRALQSHRVSVTDQFADELQIRYTLETGGTKLRDDKRLADGSVDPLQSRKRGVTTPSVIRAIISEQLDDYEVADLIQDADASRASISTNKVGGRIEAGFNLHVIDWLDQTTTRIAEVSTG